jgi:metallo-beta-lactamase family protein
MIRIHFWGAAETVTGSKFLIEADHRKILVDCGMFQGLKKLRKLNWESLAIAPSEIDAVVLTHAHIDHTGYLPRLVKDGFRGPIYCTRATYELCQILLRDAAYLQEEDARRANRKGYTRHNPARPLFGAADAEQALELFEPVDYCEPGADYCEQVDLGEGIRCGFHPAGHILGAAWVRMEIENKSLVFSGDIGRPNDPLMRPPRAIEQADYLVLESTYGNRRHPEEDFSAGLAAVINRTAKRGGIVLVPAFAVGRSQTLIHLISELKAAGEIADLPVFLNSPMAINATDLYFRWHELHRLSDEQCQHLGSEVTFVRDAKESRALNSQRGPAIIISASGMLSGGRVLHHLKSFGPDAKNTILLCGFQAAGTRGEALIHGAEVVKIHGEYIPMHAEVVSLEGLSAHADYVELGDWLADVERPPQRVFLTHGEPSAQDAFRRYLRDRLGWKCDIPELGEVVELS